MCFLAKRTLQHHKWNPGQFQFVDFHEPMQLNFLQAVLQLDNEKKIADEWSKQCPQP